MFQHKGNNLKFKKCIIFLSLLFTISAATILLYYRHKSYSSSIEKTFDFEFLNKATLNTDSIVVFDIDNTLIADEDPWERGYKKERSQANTIATLFAEGSQLNTQLDRQTRDTLWSIYAQSLKQMVIDSKITELIKTLQAKGIKVIALTRFLVGKIGTIDSLEDFRISQLKDLNIDFSPSFPNNNYLVFKEYNFEGKSPLFKDGILFTTLACSKGELLYAFFEKIHWYPNQVIMFDDKLDQLKTVHDVLAKHAIPFRGFEYKGAEKLNQLFDKNIAEFQMQYLINYGKWVNGAEAQSILQSMTYAQASSEV